MLHLESIRHPLSAPVTPLASEHPADDSLLPTELAAVPLFSNIVLQSWMKNIWDKLTLCRFIKAFYLFRIYSIDNLILHKSLTAVNTIFSLGILQLVLEAHNVPELSAGVNCTFEDVAEMNGLVEGNRIKCSSPAEKEMPRIIVDKGEGICI